MFIFYLVLHFWSAVVTWNLRGWLTALAFFLAPVQFLLLGLRGMARDRMERFLNRRPCFPCP